MPNLVSNEAKKMQHASQSSTSSRLHQKTQPNLVHTTIVVLTGIAPAFRAPAHIGNHLILNKSLTQ